MDDIIRGEGKVLILDDDYCIIEVLSQMLTEIGYTSLSAMDCEKAISILSEIGKNDAPVLVIIVDLSVEYCKDGRRIIDILKESHPDLKSIVSSGSPRHPAMLDHIEHGYTGILKKPYTIEDLSRVLHTILTTESDG